MRSSAPLWRVRAGIVSGGARPPNRPPPRPLSGGRPITPGSLFLLALSLSPAETAAAAQSPPHKRRCTRACERWGRARERERTRALWSGWRPVAGTPPTPTKPQSLHPSVAYLIHSNSINVRLSIYAHFNLVCHCQRGPSSIPGECFFFFLFTLQQPVKTQDG